MSDKIMILISLILIVFTLGSVSTAFAADDPFELKKTLFESNSGQFGSSVTTVGGNFVVGTPLEFVGNVFKGDFAFGAIYYFDGQTNDLIRRIRNPSTSVLSSFGNDLSAFGNQVIVGGSFDSTAGSFAGIARLHNLDNGDLIHAFVNPNLSLAGSFNLFGGAVDIHNNQVVVGAAFDDTTAPFSGAAYLFDAISGDPLHSFFRPSASDFDFFGTSVAINDNKILIGAPGNDPADSSKGGAAFVFDATSGNLIRTFENPNVDSLNDSFGDYVDIYGNKILIGAPGYAGGTGAAYLFDLLTGQLINEFLNPFPNAGDHFGGVVSFIDERILIGETPFPSKAGSSAYLFDGISADLIQTFLNPHPNTAADGSFDKFGSVIAGFENKIYIGDPYDNFQGDKAGAVYVYEGPLTSSTVIPEPSTFMSIGFGLFGLMFIRRKH